MKIIAGVYPISCFNCSCATNALKEFSTYKLRNVINNYALPRGQEKRKKNFSPLVFISRDFINLFI